VTDSGLPKRVHTGIDYLSACWSDSTRRSYAFDVQDFMRWGGKLPTTTETVCQYLIDRIATHSIHTLKRRLIALRAAHTQHGHDDPTQSPHIRRLMRGMQRIHGSSQRRARPILREELRQMHSFMLGMRGARDSALLLLGFCAALRRSELVAINVEDLEFSARGLTVRLSRSKTDQIGQGRVIAVPRSSNLCAVESVERWIDRSGLETAALFRSINKANRPEGRLAAQSVSVVVKEYAAMIGIDPQTVSGHSLRAGFVTSAVRSGASLVSIQRQTGHASLDMLARYIRTNDPFHQNANDAF
jgi:site-specific recombinase XerD